MPPKSKRASKKKKKLKEDIEKEAIASTSAPAISTKNKKRQEIPSSEETEIKSERPEKKKQAVTDAAISSGRTEKNKQTATDAAASSSNGEAAATHAETSSGRAQELPNKLEGVKDEKTQGSEGAVGSLCQVCGKPSAKCCSRCQGRKYCSVECQRTDWKTHKQHCVQLGPFAYLGLSRLKKAKRLAGPRVVPSVKASDNQCLWVKGLPEELLLSIASYARNTRKLSWVCRAYYHSLHWRVWPQLWKGEHLNIMGYKGLATAPPEILALCNSAPPVKKNDFSAKPPEEDRELYLALRNNDDDNSQEMCQTDLAYEIAAYHVCPNISDVFISGTVTPDLVRALSKLSQLLRLTFNYCKIPVDEMALVARNCTKLWFLDFGRYCCCDEVLQMLEGAPSLQLVVAERCNVSGRGLKSLSTCPSLRRLDMQRTVNDYSPDTTVLQGLQALAKGAPGIEYMNFSECEGITSDCLTFLSTPLSPPPSDSSSVTAAKTQNASKKYPFPNLAKFRINYCHHTPRASARFRKARPNVDLSDDN
eukprot:gb/GEZN01004264.1/.p1 GENE.gb/GEZN01004264.1/~~gb/GEZN01004264.1/.p1  ORF type:complete len:534 (-),score=60.80 gb/GEZN01004264.1/:116-1717(-)